MKETTEYIKNFNVGDKVTSTNSILLDRGFRGVTGTIRTLVKDDADSWQYLIDLDDGRELQCDDCHLVYPSLTDDQQVVLEWFKNEKKDQPFATIADFVAAYFEGAESEVPLKTMVAFEFLTNKQQFQVLAAFAEWGLGTLDN